MTKQELIALTLKQLSINLESQPECFELECSEITPHKNSMSDAIIWKPKFDQDGNIIADPNNNPRTVIVMFNKMTREIGCYIFLRDFSNVGGASTSTPDASACIVYRFPPWMYKNYRKLMSLKKRIIKIRNSKDRERYLSKLCSVFPGTFEEDLLGKK